MFIMRLLPAFAHYASRFCALMRSYLGQLLYLEKRGYIARGKTRFYGASLGCMFSCAIILGEINPTTRERFMTLMMQYVARVHDGWLANWGTYGLVAKDILEETLPEDVSPFNNRLFVSLTCLVPFPHNVLVSNFRSKTDLIEALLASQYIPGWSMGLAPFSLWRGRPALDGGFTDNLPRPTPGKSDLSQRRLLPALSPEVWSHPELRIATKSPSPVPPQRALSSGIGTEIGMQSEPQYEPQLQCQREPMSEPGGDSHFSCTNQDGEVFRPPPSRSAQDSIYGQIRQGYLHARSACKGPVLAAF